MKQKNRVNLAVMHIPRWGFCLDIMHLIFQFDLLIWTIIFCLGVGILIYFFRKCQNPHPLVDVNPESYLERTDCSFSLQTPSVSIVLSFLKKIDEKKATGLDRIPSKLLKMAASIIAPSLTSIFSKSILTGIYPND